MENYYPLFINLRGKKCVVIGGGEAAADRISELLQCRATVAVVSPRAVSRISAWAGLGWITWLKERYHEHHLEGAFLVICTVRQAELNQQVYRDCHTRNILLNATGAPEAGCFIFPTVVSRGPLTIAISTEGKCPAFAHQLKRDLEEQFTETHGAFLSYLGGLRDYIWEELPDETRRSALMEELASPEFFKLYRNLPLEALESRIAAMIARIKKDTGA
ncbi:MAG TPA: bifunctional precorrin-2 dehydrogenase/sirohydrochlorin ferrochelatase [Bacillota bacterium]|nr:bifunctional precorrin-2 dehydrogenase/sirohydrochlorin ferrochelatase [Bacillota bacterium]